jgi:hypothetical protein
LKLCLIEVCFFIIIVRFRVAYILKTDGLIILPHIISRHASSAPAVMGWVLIIIVIVITTVVKCKQDASFLFTTTNSCGELQILFCYYLGSNILADSFGCSSCWCISSQLVDVSDWKYVNSMVSSYSLVVSFFFSY